MNHDSPNPPYFDVLFDRIAAGDHDAVTAFGRHVHWGCWDHPELATGEASDYLEAAERLCRRVCDSAGIDDGHRVIDVGCGFGGTIATLNDCCNDLSMTGINIDRRQLQRASEEVIPRGANRIKWLEANAADIPLPDACCDHVLAVECVFHFDRARFLGEAARLLGDGGRLTISDFVPDQRTADFMSDASFAGGEAIRWTYGNVDMTCSLARYQELAELSGLLMVSEDDITDRTLPTYAFLRQYADQWPNQEHTDLFLKATGWLEKASRKEMIRYMVLTFEKADVAPLM